MPVWRTTTMCSSDSRSPIAASTAALTGAVLPLRRAPSTVISALALGDLHPLLDRLGREPAEHDVVRRADPRAREHRDDDLGDHRQVDPDDVALADAELLERVRSLCTSRVQLGVGDRALLALLAGPVERDPVAVAGLDVPVQAVVGHVEPAVGEPLVERRVRVVQHRRERLVPVQGSRLLGPEGVRVELGPRVERGVVDASRWRRSAGAARSDPGAGALRADAPAARRRGATTVRRWTCSAPDTLRSALTTVRPGRQSGRELEPGQTVSPGCEARRSEATTAVAGSRSEDPVMPDVGGHAGGQEVRRRPDRAADRSRALRVWRPPRRRGASA